MDDQAFRAFRSIVFCLLFLSGIIAQAVEFEHLSLEQKAQLEVQFERAKSLAELKKEVEGRKWSCDMFGVRSRMQVKRNVKLYSLKKRDTGSYSNSGAQVVSQYRESGNTLHGENERFEDQVRVTEDGRLISRLSLRGPSQPNMVIAYSLCR